MAELSFIKLMTPPLPKDLSKIDQNYFMGLAKYFDDPESAGK